MRCSRQASSPIISSTVSELVQDGHPLVLRGWLGQGSPQIRDGEVRGPRALDRGGAKQRPNGVAAAGTQPQQIARHLLRRRTLGGEHPDGGAQELLASVGREVGLERETDDGVPELDRVLLGQDLHVTSARASPRPSDSSRCAIRVA